MALELKTNWLDNIHIATPCRADWTRMDKVDGDLVHFCRSCEKNVYNVSLMSSSEAKNLIMAHEGNVCLRLARRRDGTLITNDCPVGQTTRRTRRFWGSGIAALLFAIIPTPLSDSLAEASAWLLRGVPGMEGVADTVEKTPGRSLVAWWQDKNRRVTMGMPPPVRNIPFSPSPSAPTTPFAPVPTSPPAPMGSIPAPEVKG